MFKRMVAIILCACFVLSLCGCDINKQQNEHGNSSITDNQSGKTESGEKTATPKDTEMTRDYTNPAIYTLDTLVSMGIEQPRTSDKTIDKKSAEMLKVIENRPDTLKPKSGGKYIYVANDGVDG